MSVIKRVFLQKSALPLVVFCLSLFILNGCGRRGAPELPPSAMMQDEHGRQVKKPKIDKPFIADGLIW